MKYLRRIIVLVVLPANVRFQFNHWTWLIQMSPWIRNFMVFTIYKIQFVQKNRLNWAGSPFSRSLLKSRSGESAHSSELFLPSLLSVWDWLTHSALQHMVISDLHKQPMSHVSVSERLSYNNKLWIGFISPRVVRRGSSTFLTTLVDYLTSFSMTFYNINDW